MAKTETNTSTNALAGFQPMGRGVHYAVKDGIAFFAVAVTPDARTNAQPSASGKTRTLGTTGGLIMIPGTDLKANVTISAPNA